MLPHWKKQKPRQRPVQVTGRRLRMERCEDRRMLSVDAFIGTVDLFGDQLTVVSDGGFFYPLDQGQHNEQVITATVRSSNDFLGSYFLSVVDADDSLVDFNSWEGNSYGLDLLPIALSDSDEALEGFLPRPEIGRIPLVPPTIVEQGNAAANVISLASLFDANPQTHDAELLAIRSALLASHLNQPLPTEVADVQTTNPVVLQEAESDSTWDRVWSFELASFSPSQPLASPKATPENPSVPNTATPRTQKALPVSFLPSEDSLSYRFDKNEVALPLKESANFPDAHAEALAELDHATLSSSAWGLAADRRGGLAVTVIALLAVQRVWNSSSVTASEEKEEPRRNNATMKTKW